MRISNQLQYLSLFVQVNVICLSAAAIGQAIHELIPPIVRCLWFLAGYAVILGKGFPLLIENEKQQLEVLRRSRKK